MVKKMSTSKLPNRMTYESGGSCFHYTVERGVCFLTLADRGYPKKLAYQYLEEIQNEFLSLYSGEIDSIARPYACIKFDRFIQKTKKLYLDTRTQVSRGRARGGDSWRPRAGLTPGPHPPPQRNLDKLNEELAEVQTIMTRNIQEVLGHGERLDNVSRMSSSLVAESKQVRDRTGRGDAGRGGGADARGPGRSTRSGPRRSAGRRSSRSTRRWP